MTDPFKSLFDELPLILIVHFGKKVLFANKAALEFANMAKESNKNFDLLQLCASQKDNLCDFIDIDGKSRTLTITNCPINWRGMKAECAMIETIDAQIAAQIRRVLEFERDTKQTRSRFLAAISHEMRTPLNALINLSFLLKSTDLDINQSEIVDISYASAKELLDRIEDVLEYSQLETERIQPTLEPTIISNEFDGVIGELEVLALNKGIGFEINIAPELSRKFMASGSAIRRLLRHLGENAVNYTQEGNINISFEVGEDAQGIFLKVEDTGEGIDEIKLQTIFQPFEFTSDPINRVNGGLSLGLALSRSIARSLGGDLTIESKLGIGTTANVYLPFAALSGDDAEMEHFEDTPMRILVAEDNRTNQKVISMILDQLGHSCVCTDDGNKCIEALMVQDFDLILMDLHMPFKDGYEASKDIRNLGKTLPIVALTADAREEARAKAIECGMNGFITKPLIVSELHAVLCEIEEMNLESALTKVA